MKIAKCVAASLCAVLTGAAAQSFVDLDFDSATLPGPADGVYALPWDQGAPGWSHPDGDSTDHVSYPFGHVGYSQTYVLTPSPFGAASGPYGFAMRGGTFHEDEPRGGFVLARIWQTGQVAPSAISVNLLSSSYLFELVLGGKVIPMRPVGLDPSSPTYSEDLMGYSGEWTGDVSAFAGQVVELEIIDVMVEPNPPMLEIDQIQFLPAPEPTPAALIAAALLGMVLAASVARPSARA